MNFARRGFRTGVFVDNVNLYVACRDEFGRTPDHARILKTALADNILYRAIAYGVRLNGGVERWRAALEKYGYEVRDKRPHYGKADWDVEIVVDVWRMIEHLDMVVIVSGDGDFTSLIYRCHELGKVVRVIGVDGRTSGLLVRACDEFVPITEDMLLANKEEEK